MVGDQLDEVWRALADPTRRRLLDLLRDKPRTTSDLCQPFGLSRFAIMKHLGVLEAAGLVLVRRQGRERWNYLNAVPIRQLYERWVSNFAGRWAASMLDLKRTVEDKKENGAMADTSKYRVLEIALEVTVQAPRERAFDGFTRDIDKWWSFRGAPGSVMHFETAAGGRVYEEHAAQQYCFLWGTVLESRRPARVRIVDPYGAIRPGVNGEIRAEFEEAGAATKLKLTQFFIGDADPEMLECTRDGWRTLIDRNLRAWVERGEACEHEAT